jgi:hypothetical protein
MLPLAKIRFRCPTEIGGAQMQTFIFENFGP